jgi:hypothetical protein
MAEQFLSDFTTPTINGIAARQVLANEVLKNISQNVIEYDGKGVTNTFTTDTAGAEIRVVRVKPLTQKARELGAGLNGGNFNTGEDTVATEVVGLRVITVIDKVFDIPAVSQDMIPVDLLQKSIDNFGQLVNRNINAMTLAGKFWASLKAETPSIYEIDPDATDFQTPVLEANSKLDDGDAEHGIDIFPTEGRVIVIKPSFRPKLLSKAILSLGGSNYAQAMLAGGQLSPGSNPTKMANGYVGDFDGVPVHICTEAVWRLAEEYLGLPSGELDTVVGYISSDVANARGIAQGEQIKIIDSPSGQGIRVQPLLRMGFESWYAKGNVFLVNGKANAPYSNPIGGLEGLKEGITKVLAPASRAKPSIAIAIDDSTKKPTATVTFGSGKSLATGTNLYYISTSNTDKLTVSEFLTKYAAASGSKGEYTSGSALNIPITAGTYYFYYLAVDNDGTSVVAKSAAIVVTG